MWEKSTLSFYLCVCVCVCVCVCRKEEQLDKLLANCLPPQCVIYPSNVIKDFSDLIELTHWKRLWCWEGLGGGGEGDDRGWDGWMASLTWWTWIWVNSTSWWWTERSGMLQFMGSQSRTQLSDWTELKP